MLYKTITLELLQEQPERYEALRSTKRLLPAMDAYATDLKTRHDAWMDELRRLRPGSEMQISSEALELAIGELRQAIQGASPPSEAEPFSLDAMMGYLKRHTPPA